MVFVEHKHLEKNGNLAFEVILKPASGNSPLRAISLQNSNRLSLSENDIKHKLHMADERRQVGLNIAIITFHFCH